MTQVIMDGLCVFFRVESLISSDVIVYSISQSFHAFISIYRPREWTKKTINSRMGA